MTLEQFKKRAKKLPEGPGVYFFLDRRKKVLYIGKAASLRSRVRSYFAPGLAETRSQLITNMVHKATSLDWRTTDSVLEALILEANLIKTYKPESNTDLKDDKSWNYVVITKEEYPRVLLVREKELTSQSVSLRRDVHDPNSSARHSTRFAKTFGPFPHGLQLQEALKLVRRIFPYRDSKCVPGQGRPCFNRQIGLCPGVCTGEASKGEYRKTIRNIALLFSGKKKQLITNLKRQMRTAAKEERFEEAQIVRKQVFALEHIHDVSLIKEEYKNPTATFGTSRTLRIEAYDVAHLRGSAAVGVMVVVEDGVAKKSDYRKFRIRSAKAGDDTGALREVLGRRLSHDEWPLPRAVAVDGGAAQVNAAKKVLDRYGVGVPVVGVVKDERHRPRDILGDRAFVKDKERDILLANSEAHRFAIGYHRGKLRRMYT